MNTGPTLMIVLVVATGLDSCRVQEEKQNLEGTWKVLAAESRGEIVPRKEIEDMEVIFTPGSIQVREKGEVQERFTYKLDPTTSPRTIDFTFTHGKKKGRTDRGIYLLDGNNLKICMQENPEAPRPVEFMTRPNTEVSLIVLRRFK